MKEARLTSNLVLALFLVLFCGLRSSPVHAERLCEALEIPCIELSAFSPEQPYAPLSYTHQRKTDVPEARISPFDPTTGFWLGSIQRKSQITNETKVDGRFMAIITEEAGYNRLVLLRLNPGQSVFQPVWEGKLQPYIGATVPGWESSDGHNNFAIVTAASDEPLTAGAIGTAEFVWLQIWPDSSWWNELSLRLPPDPETPIGQAFANRLELTGLAVEWSTDGLRVSEPVTESRIKDVLFHPESATPYSGELALKFERMLPHHAAAMMVPSEYWPSELVQPQFQSNRAVTLIEQLKQAADRNPGSPQKVSASEQAIFEQWLPWITPTEYRANACRNSKLTKELEAFNQQVVDAWVRIEDVTDQLPDSWDRVLPQSAKDKFDALHAEYGLLALPVLLSDVCTLNDEAGASALSQVVALANEIASVVEGYLQLETYEQRLALAAYQEFSKFYNVRAFEGDLRSDNGTVSGWALGNQTWSMTYNADFSECRFFLRSQQERDEAVEFLDSNCNGEFLVMGSHSADWSRTAAELGHFVRDVLNPTHAVSQMQFLPEAQNALADFALGLFSIDHQFFSIHRTFDEGENAFRQVMKPKLKPIRYSTTTYTGDSGGYTAGPTTSNDYVIREYPFGVTVGGQSIRYTVGQDRDDRFLLLDLQYDPPLPSTGLSSLYADEIRRFRIFQEIERFDYRLLQQRAEVNGEQVQNDRVAFMNQQIRSMLEPMGHHLLIATRLIDAGQQSMKK